MEVKYQKVLSDQIEDVTGYEQMGESAKWELSSIYWLDND
jgi:hypothetical protein